MLNDERTKCQCDFRDGLGLIGLVWFGTRDDIGEALLNNSLHFRPDLIATITEEMDEFLAFTELMVAGDDELGVVVIQQGLVLQMEGLQPLGKDLDRVVLPLRQRVPCVVVLPFNQWRVVCRIVNPTSGSVDPSSSNAFDNDLIRDFQGHD